MAHWGMEDVQACFGDTADLNTRQITVGGQTLGLLFLDGLTSGGDIAEQVLKPLMETVKAEPYRDAPCSCVPQGPPSPRQRKGQRL